MLLDLQGHDTQVAFSASQALTRLESFQPEVALLDIGLPEINGYELAARLRSDPQWHGLRLIALTGYGQPEDRQRTQAAGFDDHLVKPVDLAALERTMAGMTVEGGIEIENEWLYGAARTAHARLYTWALPLAAKTARLRFPPTIDEPYRAIKPCDKRI
jgi:CheY-like chemotaxis protein